MADVLCYNRGCGKSFNPRNNPENGCCFHPGAPYFHETYKGWTCCNKRSSDFTTFLNFPGCTQGLHSNVKPEEPEAITGKKDDRTLEQQIEEVQKHRSPEPAERTPRPDFNKAPLIRMNPSVAESLKSANPTTSVTIPLNSIATVSENGSIPEGEPCKNGGCKVTFSLTESSSASCKYHPGVPIFHEGMKYWSCCQKKTSDFQTFLNQEGCMLGEHKWKKDSVSLSCKIYISI